MNEAVIKLLIAKCLQKDRISQKHLYEHVLPYLNAICQRYTYQQANVHDVLQNTFINIFKNLHQFDSTKASFKTWITKIAINCCLKKNERHRRTFTQELILPLHERAVRPQVLNDLSNEELLIWLKNMPDKYYQVLNMYVIDGFSHEEIASILNISVASSRKQLSRARGWIKNKLNANIIFSFSI